MTANTSKTSIQIANTEELAARSIGHILVSTGRLTPDAAEEIHRTQCENDVLFGETGISMGLISREDVAFAIARQFKFSFLRKGDSAISEDLVSAYDPFGQKSEAFKKLRTYLLLHWFETEHKTKTLSVLSAQRGEGRSYVAANLAVSFSQLGHRTLLIDTNFRHSKLHDQFGVSNRRGLSTLLLGKGSSSFFLSVEGLRNLFILPSGPLPPNPQELLSQAYFPDLLNELSKQFDLLILDTAAGLPYSDATAVALRTSASIVVARQGHSKVEHLRQMSEGIRKTGGNLLGSVLLDF